MRFTRRNFFNLIAGAFMAMGISTDAIRTKVRGGWVLREDDT
ncbi:MAG: hypothetical protein NXI13_03025 [Proteobacteria bacterium]|nr:hypothetical protein [Pseudomonadota bacterium]